MTQETIFKIATILSIIGLYLLYKLFNKPNKEFQKEINEILTSDKYKVKGQYD